MVMVSAMDRKAKLPVLLIVEADVMMGYVTVQRAPSIVQPTVEANVVTVYATVLKLPRTVQMTVEPLV